MSEPLDDLDLNDVAYHAPTEYVWKCMEERDTRKKRDREELQDLWREEVQARKREHAARFLR